MEWICEHPVLAFFCIVFGIIVILGIIEDVTNYFRRIL